MSTPEIPKLNKIEIPQEQRQKLSDYFAEQLEKLKAERVDLSKINLPAKDFESNISPEEWEKIKNHVVTEMMSQIKYGSTED